MPRALLALTLILTVVLASTGVGIALIHRASKNELLRYFASKATNSAGFVSTYLSQQGARETTIARTLLNGQAQLGPRFQQAVASFGSRAAVLLDSSGRLLEVDPADPAILGSRIAGRYPHLSAAEAGHVAVSGVVPSAARGERVIAIAVPYQTPQGRRVFSVAYPVAGSVLSAFIDHTVAYKRHTVLLVDAARNVIAAAPHTSIATLRAADASLFDAVAHSSHGVADVAGTPSVFVTAHVAGTPWQLVVAVPSYELFASIDGAAFWLPWIVLGLIVILAFAVVVLFSRSLVAHGRLERLSADLAEAAQTDLLTGLANRRSLEERMPQAWAYANRHGEPLSVILIDLDDFKQINDTYGHAAGDALLCGVSECMRKIFRASDIFGRWGGDEFLAFLPSTDTDGAAAAGERLQKEVESLDLAQYGPSEQVTLSFGCSSASGLSVHDLIIDADKALYRAKRAQHHTVVTDV